MKPSDYPTTQPSGGPTAVPSGCPSLQPTSQPSFSPSRGLLSGIVFNVTQELEGLTSAEYNKDKALNDDYFMRSLDNSVPKLQHSHIAVLFVTERLPSAPSALSNAFRQTSALSSLALSSASAGVKLVYVVTASLQELGYQNELYREAYDELRSEIFNASTGSNSSLELSLQSLAGQTSCLLSKATVPLESFPVYSDYTAIYLHTPLPSSQPTSSPSCVVGHFGEGGSKGCQPCAPGTYLGTDMIGELSCRSCPMDSFNNEFGASKCDKW